MNKMASNEAAEDSIKSLTTDKDATVSELKVNENKLPITTSVSKNNERNNAANVEDKKDLISEQSDTTGEKKVVNIKSQDQPNLSLATNKNEQDDKQDVKEKVKQQETDNMVTSPHPESTDDIKDLNNENNKDFLKSGVSLKRKRKSQR